jgi:N-glycosylase/DNA lyase
VDYEVGYGKLGVKVFNLRHTFESAQPLTFHANFDDVSNTLTYIHRGHIINIRHDGNTDNGNICVASKDINYAAKEVAKRFRVNDNMPLIYKKISTDRFMKDAVNSYKGMRLTLNDPWESTVVFIISQFNNVKRIRLITKSLIEKFGVPIKDEYDKPVGKMFPESGRIANASEKEISSCGAGFRAKYIKKAAEHCTYNLDLDKLNGKSYDEIKDSLVEIKGIGEKVADCISLMGYGKLEAFPIDVWVQRTLSKTYFRGKKIPIRKLHEFADERWGKYQGYAQQYLFHHGRTNGR